MNDLHSLSMQENEQQHHNMHNAGIFMQDLSRLYNQESACPCVAKRSAYNLQAAYLHSKLQCLQWLLMCMSLLMIKLSKAVLNQ